MNQSDEEDLPVVDLTKEPEAASSSTTSKKSASKIVTKMDAGEKSTGCVDSYK